MGDVVVTDDPGAGRYEARVDGELAGFSQYRVVDGIVVFIHTEVDPGFEGRGVGGAIARQALDAIRAAGEHQVLPLCPFIRSWIRKHPEYADLVHRGLPPPGALDLVAPRS